MTQAETKMAENDLTYTSESRLGIRCGKWVREGKSDGQGSIQRATERRGRRGGRGGRSGLPEVWCVRSEQAPCKTSRLKRVRFRMKFSPSALVVQGDPSTLSSLLPPLASAAFAVLVLPRASERKRMGQKGDTPICFRMS